MLGHLILYIYYVPFPSVCPKLMVPFPFRDMINVSNLKIENKLYRWPLIRLKLVFSLKLSKSNWDYQLETEGVFGFNQTTRKSYHLHHPLYSRRQLFSNNYYANSQSELPSSIIIWAIQGLIKLKLGKSPVLSAWGTGISFCASWWVQLILEHMHEDLPPNLSLH